MKPCDYVTIPQLAKMLGLSRIAVYRRVKSGQIAAVRIGRTFAIPRKHVAAILGRDLRPEDKRQIEAAVRKTCDEYGEVLRLLGKE